MREVLRARCASVPADDAEGEGRAAARWLAEDARCRGAGRVAVFASTRGEPDARPVFDWAVRTGHEALFPRCPSKESMEFAPVGAWDELVAGRYGLLEPMSQALPEPWRSGDLVLVPGLAFDRLGGRLGRGGGHYDRCFEASPRGVPWLVGFGFSFQIVDEVPMDVHDRRLDGVLTGSGLEWLAGAVETG